MELAVSDVRDPYKVKQALKGVDAVYHYAAMVGVGQSMYEISNYTEVNNMGTAVLLDALAKNPVKKLIVASSMSIYGEGLYKDESSSIKAGVERSLEQQWHLGYLGTYSDDRQPPLQSLMLDAASEFPQAKFVVAGP